MQTMIDPTVLALCIASGAFVLVFAFAGILYRQGKNVEMATANLVDRLAIEFWSEQRLSVGIERTINQWSPDMRANLRRMIKTGEASSSFRAKIDGNSSLQATLSEVVALKIEIYPDHPTVNLSIVNEIKKDTALLRELIESIPSSLHDLPRSQTPSEFIVATVDRGVCALKALKGAVAYIIGSDGRVFIGTVANYRIRFMSEREGYCTSEVWITCFDGTKHPVDLVGGGVWREITKVCWTQHEAKKAVDEQINAVRLAANAVFTRRKKGEAKTNTIRDAGEDDDIIM
jgi:hypothetical protein